MARDVRGELVANENLDEPTRAELEHLVNISGVGTPAGRLYLARRLVWHLGRGDAPIPSRELTGYVTGFIERRARELVEQHRRRLPAVRESTLEVVR